MIEIDGPPRAWFEDAYGWKYPYVVYAIGRVGESPVEVMQAYANWRREYEDPDSILVWRARPQLVYEDDKLTAEYLDGRIIFNSEPKPYWKMYCRCVKVPIGGPDTMLVKPEGEQIPFLV
jgi:hypothetical protein